MCYTSKNFLGLRPRPRWGGPDPPGSFPARRPFRPRKTSRYRRPWYRYYSPREWIRSAAVRQFSQKPRFHKNLRCYIATNQLTPSFSLPRRVRGPSQRRCRSDLPWRPSATATGELVGVVWTLHSARPNLRWTAHALVPKGNIKRDISPQVRNLFATPDIGNGFSDSTVNHLIGFYCPPWRSVAICPLPHRLN